MVLRCCIKYVTYRASIVPSGHVRGAYCVYDFVCMLLLLEELRAQPASSARSSHQLRCTYRLVHVFAKKGKRSATHYAILKPCIIFAFLTSIPRHSSITLVAFDLLLSDVTLPVGMLNCRRNWLEMKHEKQGHIQHATCFPCSCDTSQMGQALFNDMESAWKWWFYRIHRPTPKPRVGTLYM